VARKGELGALGAVPAVLRLPLLTHTATVSAACGCAGLSHHTVCMRVDCCLLPTCQFAAEEKKAGGPEKLTHSLDILEAFATLKLEVGGVFLSSCTLLLSVKRHVV